MYKISNKTIKHLRGVFLIKYVIFGFDSSLKKIGQCAEEEKYYKRRFFFLSCFKITHFKDHCWTMKKKK